VAAVAQAQVRPERGEQVCGDFPNQFSELISGMEKAPYGA
jgi:hypothetical protein